MRAILPVCGLVFFAILIWGCQRDTPFNPTIEVQDFPDSVNQIIQANCATRGCHAGSDLGSDLDLTSWTAMHQGSNFGTVMIPGWPDWSHLFMHSNTYEELGITALPAMPFNADEYLSRTEVLTLRNWINAGGLSKKGDSYWASRRAETNGKAFILCAGSDLMAVIDLQTELVMDFVEVGGDPLFPEGPHYIEISPDNQFLYLTFITSGDSLTRGSAIVEKYGTDNYALVGRCQVDSDPALIVLSQSGNRMVISHYNSLPAMAKLTLINTETMEILHEAVGDGTFLASPHGMASTFDFRTLYVGAGRGNYYTKVSIVEDKFDQEDEKIRIDPSVRRIGENPDYEPYHCYLLEDRKLFFVTCSLTNDVRVFNTENDSLLAVIPVGETPRLMDYDPVSGRMFIACGNEENFAEQGSLKGCVTVLNVASLTVEKNIFRIGQRPHGIRVDPERRRLYVSTENNGGKDPPHHFVPGRGTLQPGKFHVIDLNTLEVIQELDTDLAFRPNQIAITK
ncbi:MAG: hypothetical protein AAGI38_19360 [Bacteroidota bacterium]